MDSCAELVATAALVVYAFAMQHLILIAEALYWLPLLYILHRYGLHRHTAISDHVATGTPRAIYTPTTIVSMTLLAIFCYQWLFPAYDIGAAGYILIGVAYVFIVAATLIPRVQDILTHDFSAGLAGSAIAILLLLFVFSDSVDTHIRILVLASYAVMLVTGPFLLKKDRNNFFLYQLAYFATFHACLVALTYL